MVAAEKSKRPANTPFKQQNLKAWRPILTPKLVICLFLLVGVIFVPIGAAVLAASNTVVEAESDDYGGDVCCAENCDDEATRKDHNPCTFPIHVTKEMEPPVYMYYKLSNYYQNHRRYVKSRSDMQLRGMSGLTPTDVETTCLYKFSVGEGGSDPNSIVSPCGLIAWSVFNDTISLQSPSGDAIPLQETGIAWPSDVDVKFKNADDGSTGINFAPFAYYRNNATCDDIEEDKRAACLSFQVDHPEAGWCFPGSGYCNEDEHFIVWMRTAGLPTFRKLYAIVNETMPVGTYNITVSNGVVFGGYSWTDADGYSTDFTNPAVMDAQRRLYPVSSFDGSKRVVFSTTSWIGGKNDFLGYAYVVIGVVCIVLALSFWIKDKISPRDPGNASYVSWKKDSPAAN